MRLRRALAPAAGVGGDAVFRLRVILYQPLSRLRTRRLRGWSLSRPANITREVPDVQSEHSRRRPPDSADSCCPQAIISWWKVTNGAGNGGCSGHRRRGPWRSELLNYFLAPKLSGFRRGHNAWTGREIDVETGLQYNRARYYDGATGRWISQDPLGFDAGDGNLYRYVHNHPTSNRDPS